MKHNTFLLTGMLLDQAVALAEGWTPCPDGTWQRSDGSYVDEGPSVSWAEGGPIIERERIMLDVGIESGEHFWMACIYSERGDVHADAGTPLIAAMRAYVLAKLGAGVELPG